MKTYPASTPTEKNAPRSVVEARTVYSHTVDPTTIDRPLPIGSPTFCQCVGCGRYFRNSSSFELHIRLGPDGVVCRDPATLGMAIVEKQGASWWTKLDPRWMDESDAD